MRAPSPTLTRPPALIRTLPPVPEPPLPPLPPLVGLTGKAGTLGSGRTGAGNGIGADVLRHAAATGSDRETASAEPGASGNTSVADTSAIAVGAGLAALAEPLPSVVLATASAGVGAGKCAGAGAAVAPAVIAGAAVTLGAYRRPNGSICGRAETTPCTSTSPPPARPWLFCAEILISPPVVPCEPLASITLVGSSTTRCVALRVILPFSPITAESAWIRPLLRMSAA